MNIQSKLPTTPEEFLRWNEGREGKREFVRGKVVELMMINTTRSHVRIATNLVVALRHHLPLEYDVGSADFGVRTPSGIRYPDAFVDRVGPRTTGEDLATVEPLLVAEILSPSSYTRDFGEKLADYTGVASLVHYLILAQDEPRIWLWSRPAGERWTGPLLAAGVEESVGLPELGIALDLASVYAGLFGQNAN